MLRPVLIGAAWVVGACAAAVQQQYGADAFCPGVNKVITALQQQKPASSFCSSYLRVPSRTSTVTVTTTRYSSTTVSPLVTVTASPTVVTIATSVATASTQSTVYANTATITSLSTTIVSTSTIYTSTITSVATSTTQSTSTSTTTRVVTTNLAQCTRPSFVAKRDEEESALLEKRGQAKPACFNGFALPSAISKACGCLSLATPTCTRTVTATAARVSTITSARTTTQTSAVAITSMTTSTTTTTSTVFATQTTTVFQTISSVATTQTDTTTISTTISTSVTVSTQTSTVQRYTNFALLHSGKGLYGRIIDSVGGSGEGVYYQEGNLGSAATFAFQGNLLYHGSQTVRSYAASSGDYYAVVDRPFEQFGYDTTCTLSMPSFSGDGCPLDCRAGGGFFDLATGNNEANYNGAWGFQGSTDSFVVYAVGQT